jgi:hypothetical protein
MEHGTRDRRHAQQPERVSLGELIHQQVRGVVEQAVQEKLAALLDAGRYERRATRRGSRNGHKPRTLTGPTGPLGLTLPRALVFTPRGPKEWGSTSWTHLVREPQKTGPYDYTSQRDGDEPYTGPPEHEEGSRHGTDRLAQQPPQR